MRTLSFLCIPTLIAVCAASGCNHQTRHDYPDSSGETKAQADALREERDQRIQIIDRDQQQNNTALAFEEQQVEIKAIQQRERIAIERDQVTQPLRAKQADIRASSKRESDRLTAERDLALETLNGEEAVRVKAESASRMAESQNKAAEGIANAEAAATEATQSAAQKMAKVDSDEAKQKAAIQQRREESERQAREERLLAANRTTAKLDALGNETQNRTDRSREEEAISRSKDRELSLSIRKHIASHGDVTRGVTVVSTNGVVALRGVVFDDVTRVNIVRDIGKMAGVVKVEDHLTLR